VSCQMERCEEYDLVIRLRTLWSMNEPSAAGNFWRAVPGRARQGAWAAKRADRWLHQPHQINHLFYNPSSCHLSYAV
jgi:hypothetical protein